MNNSLINPCFSFPHLRKLHKTIYLSGQSFSRDSRNIPGLPAPSSLFTSIRLITIYWSMWSFCQQFCLDIYLLSFYFSFCIIWAFCFLDTDVRVFRSQFCRHKLRFALCSESHKGNNSFLFLVEKLQVRSLIYFVFCTFYIIPVVKLLAYLASVPVNSNRAIYLLNELKSILFHPLTLILLVIFAH